MDIYGVIGEKGSETRVFRENKVCIDFGSLILGSGGWYT